MPKNLSASQSPAMFAPMQSKLLLAALLVLMTLLVYIPAMKGELLWDDDWLVTNNPNLTSLRGLMRIWKVDWWGDKTVPDYFPVTYTSFWIEWQLWGEDPTGYHVTNILLHAISAVLVWRVLARLGMRWAWLAGALFAVHPINVASVAWIAERKNTLSMVFYLLGILCYLRFDEREGGRWYLASLGLFLLALLSKTSVVMLPLVLLLIAWWRRDRVGGRDVLAAVPFLVLAVGLSIIGILYQHYVVVRGSPIREANEGVFFRLAVAGMVPWFYMLKTVFPYPLAMVYPRWEFDPKGLAYYLPGLGLVGLMALLWWLRRWRPVSRVTLLGGIIVAGIFLGMVQGFYGLGGPLKQAWPYLLLAVALLGIVAGLWHAKVDCKPLLMGLAYFVVTLFPVLGFFTMYYHMYSFVADHWVYVSVIGLLALAAGGAEFLARRVPPVAVSAGVLVILVVLGGVTWARSDVYAKATDLWRDNIRKYPKHFLPYFNLGRVLEDEKLYDDALTNYCKSIELKADFDRPYANIGGILAQRGDFDQAARYFYRALRIYPGSVVARSNLAAVMHETGRSEEALHQLRLAEEFDEHSLLVQRNMTVVLMEMGRIDEAMEHARKAIKIQPSACESRVSLATCLFHKGRIEEAIAEAQRAVKLQPDSFEAHQLLARLFRASGQAGEAVEHYQKALAIRGDNPSLLHELGLVQVARGDLEGALGSFSKALALQPNNPEILANRAFVLVRLNRPAEAVTMYRRALELQPNWPDAMANLAWVLAHCPDPAIRDSDQAIALAKRACELTEFRHLRMVDTLASVYAAAGQYDQAIQAGNRALELARAAGNTAQAAALAQRISEWSAQMQNGSETN